MHMHMIYIIKLYSGESCACTLIWTPAGIAAREGREASVGASAVI